MKKYKIQNGVIILAAAMLLTGCQSGSDNSAETEALKEQIAQLQQQITALEQQASNNNASDNNTANDNASGSSVLNDSASDNSTLNGDVSDNSALNGDASNDAASNQTTPAQDNAQAQNDTSVGNSRQPDSIADTGTQIQPNISDGENHVSGHVSERYHDSSSPAGNDSKTNQQGASAAGATTYTMDELSGMVDAFVQKADAAAPGGTAAENMEQFFALKQEEKQIDDLLDRHEDELEYLYKIQSLTREDYKRLERELELLEDKLDAAEDRLEYTFGIDD